MFVFVSLVFFFFKASIDLITIQFILSPELVESVVLRLQSHRVIHQVSELPISSNALVVASISDGARSPVTPYCERSTINKIGTGSKNNSFSIRQKI